MNRRFADLSLEEIIETILKREPSFSDLQTKALILLRSASNSIGRLQVIHSAMNPRVNSQIDKAFAYHLRALGETTRWVQEERFFEELEKENPAATGS